MYLIKLLQLTLLLIICSGISLANTPTKADEPSHTNLWLQLSIVSQNAGHKIQMFGVDADQPDSKDFAREIKTIDHLLDQLVEKGLLKKQTFKLKPQLDLEESLIMAVGKFVSKHSDQYGYYVVREMLDVGTRQRLKEFDENAPVILNVRMPEALIKELETILANKAEK